MPGLEHRYDVQKVNDPDGKHVECRYFVLDPEHDVSARRALETYATAVSVANPDLSRDLFDWLGSICP